MSKGGGVSLPSSPDYWSSPVANQSMKSLQRYGNALSSGGFMDPNNKDIGFLNQLVTLNPEATQRAIELATRGLTQDYNRSNQDIVNTLAANNQLESSVTGNRLLDSQDEYLNVLGDINSQFYLADVERSMNNIGGLFETGLNTTGNVGNMGLQREQMRNNFNQQNYENKVAAKMAANKGGGLMDTLLGGGGGAAMGALAGLALAIPTGGLSIPAGLAIGAGLGGAGGAAMGAMGNPSGGTMMPLAAGSMMGGMGGFQSTNNLGGTGGTSYGLLNSLQSSGLNTGFGNNALSFGVDQQYSTGMSGLGISNTGQEINPLKAGIYGNWFN
jgi:hypothetical protein